LKASTRIDKIINAVLAFLVQIGQHIVHITIVL